MAALSSPSIFAEKFIKSCPCTGWFLGTSGNSCVKNGPIILERNLTQPAFSPIFIRPSQRVITPTRGRAISITANLDISNVLSTILANIIVSPNTKHWISATTKAIIKNPAQI